MRIPALVLVALVGLTGCSAPATQTSPAPSATASATPTPTATVPLVLAVHHSRAPVDVPPAAAEELSRTTAGTWDQLGETVSVVDGRTDPVAALQQVMAGPGSLALVPVTAVDERVRVLSVGGVDPLLDPAAYPLRMEGPAPVEPTITTVSIVGDIMLGRRVGRAYADDPTAPFRPFAERLAAADVTVGNFEATLSDNGSPTQGGDSFAADPAVLAGLELAGFDAVSLANNHLGDYGTTAMLETFTTFEQAGIGYFGAGADLDRARTPWILEHEGVRVGFLGTESIGETPAATADRPGTNRLNMPPRTGPLDRAALDRIAADISALDAEVDTVIVVPHWGTQYTHVSEQSQREVAARFAEAGADLVIGGHPHWVQGWEAYGEATVVHSLGNFIFDMEFSREVQEGVFVEIVLWDGEVKAVQPVPYVIEDHVPRPATAVEAAEILADVRGTSSGPYAG